MSTTLNPGDKVATTIDTGTVCWADPTDVPWSPTALVKITATLDGRKVRATRYHLPQSTIRKLGQ